jgi:hypothetical protein
MKKARATTSEILRLICVVALMMAGFAHKPPPAMPRQVQFAAYVLPDGKLPTLCLNDSATDPQKGALHDYGCDACRLAASILMPEPPRVGAQAIAFATIVRTVERQYRLQRALYPPSSGPRAPPFSVILA